MSQFIYIMSPRPPSSTPTDTRFPYTTRFRSHLQLDAADLDAADRRNALAQHLVDQHHQHRAEAGADHPAAASEDRGAADDHGGDHDELGPLDRKSSRLNSSH